MTALQNDVAVPGASAYGGYAWAYAYAGPQPHAPTRIGERAFQYDANGNQIAWESSANGTRRTLVWDEDNNLASVSDNGQRHHDQGGARARGAERGEVIGAAIHL